MIVSRTCTEIPSGQRERLEPGERRSRPLEEFRETPAYVLVGDPGAGKTTAFETEREALGDEACLITARDFLTFKPEHHPEWRGKTLFIDGLDEIRAGASDVRTPFDQVRGRLEALGKPRFRLSCREADWLGENDRKHLEAVSPDSSVSVLRLDPLTDSDVASILDAWPDIPNVDAFIRAAKERRVEGLLPNPQTLEMLADVVGAGEGWPESRMQTFEMACRQIVQEHNEDHRAGQELGSPGVPDQLLDAAGRLCALQLISGGSGYTLRGQPDEDYPALDECDYDREVLRFALSTKLFKAAADYRFTPIHRHVAEFLGAWHLAGVIHKGLPARRAISMITGEDGTVVTEMRGLSAWLAARSRDARAHLIERDPVGVGLYGDIGEFSTEEKRALLESLKHEGTRLGSLWSRAAAFGALATPELEPAIKGALIDPSRETEHLAFVEFILDVLREVGPRPSLFEILLGVVRDDTFGPQINTLALVAFVKNHPPGQEKTSKLLMLLADVHKGSVPDPDNKKLGLLLSHLYPREVPPSQVWDYLRDDPLRERTYSKFWRRTVLEQSSDEEVAELLDSLQIRLADLRPVLNSYLFRELPTKLLRRGLEKHGDELEPKRLYDWLGVGSEQLVPRYDEESVGYIRSWLEDHPDVQKALVMEGLVRCPESDEFRRQAAGVWRRFYRAGPPSDFGLWCLEQAVSMADARPRVAEHLLERAVEAHRSHSGNDGLSLEVLQEQARRKVKLSHRLDQLLSPSPIHEEHLESERRWREEEEEKQQWWIDQVRANRTALVENRAAPGLLYGLAELYFSGQKALEERLQGDRGLTNDALQGLRGVIDRKDVPDLEEILRLREQSEMHFLSLPYLAALAELEKTTDASQWDDDRIGKAIAFHESSLVDGYKPQWYQWLLAERPETVAQVLVRFALSGFRSGREDIDKISELTLDSEYAQVAKHASLPLLRSFPTRCKEMRIQDLKDLLWAALQHADKEHLQDLIERKCSLKSTDDAQRVYWFAAGETVAPGMYGDRLTDFLRGRGDRIPHLPAFFQNREQCLFELGHPFLEQFVRLVGSTVGPDQLRGTGLVTPAMQASRLVNGLIQRLSASPAKEASDALGRLVADPELSRWHHEMSHAQDAQRVIRRDAAYRHPEIGQVCQTLNGGTPGNAADLAALSMDLLQKLGEEIPKSDADVWRQYWNVDSNGGPVEPRPERSCRDTLLLTLRERLPEGVSAGREGQHPNDKRDDIWVSRQDFRVPVEVKRNQNRSLWSALRNQLIAQYTSTLGCDGYGIYLVFWFGKEYTQPPPSGDRPVDPDELRARLQATLSPTEARKISICVINVSRPDN